MSRALDTHFSEKEPCKKEHEAHICFSLLASSYLFLSLRQNLDFLIKGNAFSRVLNKHNPGNWSKAGVTVERILPRMFLPRRSAAQPRDPGNSLESSSPSPPRNHRPHLCRREDIAKGSHWKIDDTMLSRTFLGRIQFIFLTHSCFTQ